METPHGVPALSYALRESKRPGKFNKQKALELGVPEGPLFSKLQKGNTVTLKDGRTVNPDMVLGPARPGRTIVFSGDSRPNVAMIQFAKDADVLIHEATFTSEHEDIAYQYGHTTARQAAQIASEAHVGQLFLTHISPRYLDHREILKDAKQEFLHTSVPKDFDEITVSLKK
jgi:ribonuclease Z